MVLVDTHIWIEAFRNASCPIIPVLAELLLERNVCMTQIIRAELLSGAKNDANYHFLKNQFLSIPMIDEKPDLWELAAHARFRLARKGIQESLLDLSIACNAYQHRHLLWTNDKQFIAIQKIVPFKRFRG